MAIRISQNCEFFDLAYSKKWTKLILINSKILSVIRYASPILINTNNKMLSRLQVLIMKCSRPILGFRSYKLSTHKIMNELKWLTIYYLITKENIVFIRRVVLSDLPIAITELITPSLHNLRSIRSLCKIIVKDNQNKPSIAK